MKHGSLIWLGLTAGLSVWAALSGAALMPFALLVVAAACAAHAPTRRIVEGHLDALFSYGFLRGCLIVMAGAAFIQFLPLEIALFAAADILAYVEVAAALAMIAANVRLKAVRAVIVRRWQGIQTRTVRRAGRAFRIVRRRLDRLKPSDDPDGWAFA